MARTSKKAREMLLTEPAEKIKEPLWKAGIYARLSVDSNSEKNESIDTQIEIAKEYIRQEDDIELVECYVDLGKTGTNFKREGFEHMMTDVRGKKINCVVVKDFSRFGRNYIETGNYIEKIFPFMKVRFIAVTDGYDSECMTGDNIRLSMHLKNIVNELYAKDIAQRVKAVKSLKQEMGSYTGGMPPYGYCVKKTGDRKVLFPDDAVKDIVVKIFEMYAEGSTYREIAEELYKRKIQRPSVYHVTEEVYCLEDKSLQQWSLHTIKNILTNPVYTGTLFQLGISGKTSQESECLEMKEADITAMEHTHPSIISEDLFCKVSQRFQRQSKYSGLDDFSHKIPQSKDILKGKVYCGGCGHCLIRNPSIKTLANGNRVRNYYYACPNKGRMDDSVCRCQGISLKVLEKIIKAVLEKEFAFSEMQAKDYCKESMQEAEKRKAMIREKRSESMRQQEKLTLAGSKLYLSYCEGGLPREVFLERKKKAEEEMEILKKQEEGFKEQEEQIVEETDKINYFIRRLVECKGDYKFDRELIECLIRRINVYSGHQVEIIWNYRRNHLLS